MLRPNISHMYFAMADKGLSATELSIRAGVSCNTVYKMKNGHLVRPEYAGKVAKALGVDIRYIIVEEDDREEGARR